jgi:hypothetical protein
MSGFPCLEGHVYSGCVGVAKCPAERCWNGRRLRIVEGGLRVDAFEQPRLATGYIGGDCPNCVHAVDLDGERQLHAPGGRGCKQWTMCELGLWDRPASLYNLLNHRAPVTQAGHCPSLLKRSEEQMRPELAHKREGDRRRSLARRARLRRAQECVSPGRELR